jgi:FkbM family methyltransferase
MAIVATKYGRMHVISSDKVVSQSLELYGEWAMEELDLLAVLIVPGMCVLDVGAFIGTHTLAFSAIAGPAGKVYAFEPRREIFGILSENIALNDCVNVVATNIGLGEGERSLLLPAIDLTSDENFGGLSLSDAANQHSPAELYSVRVARIDDLDIADIGLIKLDVEGMERNVLDGAVAAIDRDRPLIFCECNDVDSGLAILEFCRTRRYLVYGYLTSAYNPHNFNGVSHNLWGDAKELTLLLLPEEKAVQVLSTCTQFKLFPVTSAEDLVLPMLHKPQYAYEVLAHTGASPVLGLQFPAPVAVDLHAEVDQLRAALTDRLAQWEVQRDSLAQQALRLAEQEASLVSMGTALSEREADLARNIALLAERDLLLAQKDKLLAEHEAELRRRSEEVLSRDVAMGQLRRNADTALERLAAQHRRELEQQTEYERERQANAAASAAAITAARTAREADLARNIALLAERDLLLAQKDMLLAEHVAKLWRRSEAVLSRDVAMGQLRRNVDIALESLAAQHRRELEQHTEYERERQANAAASAAAASAAANREAALSAAANREAALQHQLAAVYATQSWRLTAPLRGLKTALRRVAYGIPVPPEAVAAGQTIGIEVDSHIGNDGRDDLSVPAALSPVGSHSFLPAPEAMPPDIVTLAPFDQAESLLSHIELGHLPQPTIIFDHNGGGGSNTYTRGLVAALLSQQRAVVRVYCQEGLWYVQWLRDTDQAVLYISSTESLFSALAATRSRDIIVNSVYGYPDIGLAVRKICLLTRQLEARLDVKMHDFYPLCSSPHLSDLKQQYCGVPADHEVCKNCLKGNLAWYHSWIPKENFATDIDAWRAPFRELFAAAAVVTFFDRSSVDIVRLAFPLEDEKIAVVPHSMAPMDAAGPVDLSGPLHIGMVGTLSHIKGGNQVAELVAYVDEQQLRIPFTVVGSSYTPLPPQVEILGSYAPEDLRSIVVAKGINMILMASIIPETFSYTISEAMQMGLPIVAYDLGAQGNRVRDYALGAVVPLSASPAQLLDAIRTLLAKVQESNT